MDLAPPLAQIFSQTRTYPHLSALIRTYPHLRAPGLDFSVPYCALFAPIPHFPCSFRAPSHNLPSAGSAARYPPVTAHQSLGRTPTFQSGPPITFHHLQNNLLHSRRLPVALNFRPSLRIVLRNASSVTHIIAPVNEQNSQASNSPGFWPLAPPREYRRLIDKAR